MDDALIFCREVKILASRPRAALVSFRPFFGVNRVLMYGIYTELESKRVFWVEEIPPCPPLGEYRLTGEVLVKP